MADADESILQLENVSKRYGDKWAVRDLSLTLPAGALFAFLGPNGAGKTTTIKMITGLLRPTKGRVRVAGFDMASNAIDARRQISFVPDQPFVYEKLTGRDFLEFVRDIYHAHDAESRALEQKLVDVFEMGDYFDELAETYSHGMRQRLAFAAALLHRPRLLVLDEPMVGLDPKSMRIVKDLLRNGRGAGMTVFMSTHTLAIAEEVADQIGIIHRGQLIRCQPLEDWRRDNDNGASLEDFFLQVTAETQA